MKVKPLMPFKLLGTSISLDIGKTYTASPATNQPNWHKRKAIFVHERKHDPVGVLLEDGEYTITNGRFPGK